jgi:hypothetical protein
MKKTDRNRWNDQELSILKNCVEQAIKPSKGLQKASTLLGRTVAACSFKYHTAIKHNKSAVSQVVSAQIMGSTPLVFKIKTLKVNNGYLTIEI